MSTKLNGTHLGDHEHATATVADAGETFAAEEVAGSAPAARSTSKSKACCICGVNLVGEKRYKDAAGHYWCCDCAKADTDKKTPAVCPDCNQELTAGDLTDFEGKKLCHDCIAKRQHAAKRAAQRKAAAEEEAREQQKHYRMILLAAGATAALLVGYAIFRILR